MLGLVCKEEGCFIISSLQIYDINIYLSNTIISKYIKDVYFDQSICAFCYENFETKKFIIKLNCKHIYHLFCFINYLKHYYIYNYNFKESNSKSKRKMACCITCNNSKLNICDIFKTYKIFLERLKYLKKNLEFMLV